MIPREEYLENQKSVWFLCDLCKLGFLLEIAERTIKNGFVSYCEQYRQKQTYQQTERCVAGPSKQKSTILPNFPQESSNISGRRNCYSAEESATEQ